VALNIQPICASVTLKTAYSLARSLVPNRPSSRSAPGNHNVDRSTSQKNTHAQRERHVSKVNVIIWSPSHDVRPSGRPSVAPVYARYPPATTIQPLSLCSRPTFARSVANCPYMRHRHIPVNLLTEPAPGLRRLRSSLAYLL